MNIKIRNIEEQDIEKVVAIKIKDWKIAYKGIVDDEYLNSLDVEVNIANMKKDYRDGGFTVAEINNEIVGFCRYIDSNRFSNKYNEIDCELCALYVNMDYKQKGIGTALFEYVVKEFQSKNKKKMILWCFKENYSARKFYEKMGGKIYDFDTKQLDGKGYEEVSYVYELGKLARGELKLVYPTQTQEYKNQVMECRKIFLENKEGFDGCAGLEEVNTYEEWIDFDARLFKKFGEGFVHSTVCLAIRKKDNKLVGIIDFRHELSEFLYKYGGNIGYSVVIDERRKGYAKEILRLMLDKCREFHKDRVLLTCDKENIGSSKTIIANGGILEKEIQDDVGLTKSGVIQRYWIEL